MIELSLHKFGSNVVEKCLLFAPPFSKFEIIDRIVCVPPMTTSTMANTLEALMQSKYGNYVVQRAFEISDDSRRAILIDKIELVVKMGKVNPKRAHAKHIFTYLESKFGVYFSFSEKQAPLQQAPKSKGKPSHVSSTGKERNRKKLTKSVN